MAFSIRVGAKEDIKSCLCMIKSQALDNYGLMAEILGDVLLIEILNFKL